MSVRRSAASFGTATVLGHLSQLLWLAASTRAMAAADFGSVLAAQALYAVLQIVIDFGTNSVGARMVARGELDDRRRGEIVRMRLLLALAVAPVAVGLGVLKISGSISATLPFVLALVLFALLNVWEPYGAGDSRPWATYTFARSAVLGVAASAFLAAGATFPVPLAGGLECVAIVGVMLVFRTAPLAGLRRATRARGGPWRAVLAFGGPAFLSQTSMAAGTLVLSGSGSPAKAGIVAACVRLLSGLTAINGIVALAIFPRLAQGVLAGFNGDRHVVAVAFKIIGVLAAGATAVCVLFGGAIAAAFLGSESSREETATLVLTMAAALPVGNIIMFAYPMFARGYERATVLPIALSGPVTVSLAVGAVAVAGPRTGLVAGSLLIGQLVTMGALLLRVRASCPDLASASSRSTAIALLVGLLACASLLPGGSLPAGAALLILVAVLLGGMRTLAASLLAAYRPGRRRSRRAAGPNSRS